MSRNGTKPRKVVSVRKGPAEINQQFESQMDVLGLPMTYVKTLTLPEMTEPCRVPDQIVATSAIFKAPNVIEDLPVSGNWNPATGSTDPIVGQGQTVVFAFPGSRGAIWHSQGQSSILNLPRAISTLYDGSSVLYGGHRWMGHGLRVGSVALLPRKLASGRPLIQVDRLGGGGSNCLVSVRMDAAFTGTVTLRYTYQVAGVFTPIDTNMVVYAGTGLVSVVGIPSVIDGFYIGIADFDGLPSAIQFSLEDNAIWTTGANNACAYDIRNVDQLVDMPLTSVERPTALSALVTFMGSTLANGGNIAAARMPMAFNPSQAVNGDYYAFIASLPVYAGDFALKDGSYAWWCPDSDQEYFFRPHGEYVCDNLLERSYLAFAMRRDDITQSVRLRVDLHLETQTRSALFASAVSEYRSTFPKALEIAKTFPAVTINDDHKSLLGRAWARAKDWMRKPSNWLSLISRGVKALTGM